MSASRSPIDTLRGVFLDCQDVLSAPDVDRALAALDDVKQLVEAARALESWQPQLTRGMEHLHPQHATALSALRATLARFGTEPT